jgi:hypothetical protein
LESKALYNTFLVSNGTTCCEIATKAATAVTERTIQCVIIFTIENEVYGNPTTDVIRQSYVFHDSSDVLIIRPCVTQLRGNKMSMPRSNG